MNEFLSVTKVKEKFKVRKVSFIAVLLLSAFVAGAQTPAQFQGPTDPVSPPPSSAASVNKILCYGGTIALKGPSDNNSSAPYKTYQWYKINSSGVKQLVQQGPDPAYSENSTASGYYKYQLIVTNVNDCTSEISDIFNVFVLPQMQVTVTATSDNICENRQSNTTLTASVANSDYSYVYQWEREDQPIAGATSNTLVVTEPVSGTIKYEVTVSYVLKPDCSATAEKSINVIALPAKPVILSGD